mmetsp:Transcript_18290/g.22819  ORF Transcript_18290/g.22819 Transcript_18290/m.22819 type:complete len:84 (+) Transcript_18290:489-740(+)
MPLSFLQITLKRCILRIEVQFEVCFHLLFDLCLELSLPPLLLQFCHASVVLIPASFILKSSLALKIALEHLLDLIAQDCRLRL